MTRRTSPNKDIKKAWLCRGRKRNRSPRKLRSGARTRAPHDRHPTPKTPKKIPTKLPQKPFDRRRGFFFLNKRIKNKIFKESNIGKRIKTNFSGNERRRNESKIYFLVKRIFAHRERLEI